ncbi:hypothetical protein C0993_010674 [Termitomyces sp. T159_Od127]|nr:hypothetical protein C0993_010674 [Termitomyces sp. T159_Od127]
MAEHCSRFAQKLGIEHVTSKIDWVEPPTSDEPFEAVARAARYRALFAMMTEKNIENLAFGHHIDDQVETSLLRLSWGSTNLGAAGMKYCRRWGMGLLKGATSEYGFEGMNRWIVRPLLDISKASFVKKSTLLWNSITIMKDRILATCEANNIEYVEDPTNSQPAITLRNAIRHEIQANIQNQPQKTTMLPEDIVKRLMTLETTARSLGEFRMSLDSSIEELRSGVRVLSRQARDIDDMVDSALRSCGLPTFPGTFLFSKVALDQVENLDVRRALVLRVLRYVSPYPWGSLNADAGRRRDSISRIIDELWKRVTSKSRIRSFTAGGRVLWTPVILQRNYFKTPQIVVNALLPEGNMLGWIASRLPPLNRERLKHQGLPNTLEIDATTTIANAYREWRNGGPSTVSILYDSRYLLKFHLDKMPESLISLLIDNPADENRLMLLSKTQWFLPKITLERGGIPEMLHDKISEEPTANVFSVPRRQRSKNDRAEEIDSGWIEIQWARPLTSI